MTRPLCQTERLVSNRASARLPSALMLRTPVGGAAADRRPSQRRTIAGTEPSGLTGGHEVPGVGAAPAAQDPQRGADRPSEAGPFPPRPPGAPAAPAPPRP